MESLIPEFTESFREFFGIDPDRVYYNSEIEDLIFTSGDLGVYCQSRGQRAEWGIVYVCPDCEKLYKGVAWSDYRYFEPDKADYFHQHNHGESVGDRLIRALRDAFGPNEY